jgi:hypothetical protein
MARLPDDSGSELLAACGRMKRALAHVQCAVLDLHEAFLQRDQQQREALERQAKNALERIRDLSRTRT